MKLLLWLFILLLLIIIGIGGFSYRYYSLGYESIDANKKIQIFHDIPNKDIIITDSGSIRRTSNTFMSMPEWYIVSISADYTEWLESKKNPSDFPYWQYLKDYWIMYGKITAIMDEKIPRDHEYHSMVQVIGLSTTLEFGAKSLYENTIGRLTSFLSFSTEEDIYYSKISRKYVDFILLRPWYEFDYSSAITGLDHSSFGLRSLERYYFYLAEFFMKKHYAKIIENAAHSQFAIPDIWTQVNGTFESDINIIDPKNINITGSGIQISRYYPFTQIFPKISSHTGTLVQAIAGNKKFVVEFLSDSNITHENELFSFMVPIDSTKKRTFFYLSPLEFQSYLRDSGVELNHIYDF